jgi:hypothetical protein
MGASPKSLPQKKPFAQARGFFVIGTKVPASTRDDRLSRGSVVKVQQQHVSYKTKHEPRRSFQYSFEFRSHDESISLNPNLCQVADRGLICSRLMRGRFQA